MSLKIFGEDKNLSQQVIKILRHYFHQKQLDAKLMTANQENSIFIDTKYFTCKIPLERIENIQDIQTLQSSRTDMIIFVFNEKQQIEGIKDKIDKCINKLSPQASIICVNSQAMSQQTDWHHQEQVAQCQNFIPVVYENFYKIGKILPQWTSNSLLNQSDEDIQLFTLLDLIETTSWTNIVKKTDSKSQIKAKPQQNKNNGQLKVTNIAINSEQSKQKQQEQQAENKVGQGNWIGNQSEGNEDNGQQVNQQQMQKQMIEFEQLMQQMMAVKAMPMSNNDRKNKAEELIFKLAKSMGQ